MSWIKGREIPVALTGLCGFIILSEYYFDISILTTTSSYLTSWVTIILAFALGVGLISIMRSHFRNISSRKSSDWILSVYWFALFIIMSAVGLIYGASSSSYTWMFNNLLVPVWKTVSSTTGFFIIIAAYRAFRVRTWESTVLLFAAAFIMLENAPIGGVIWSTFPVIGSWIKMVPNIGARRGINIGMGVAAVSLGLRTFLGYERGHLGGEED